MDMYKSKLLGEHMDRAKPELNEYVETDPTGQYQRFKDVLGRGAMKTVYKAFDQVRGMEVAWNQVKLNDVFRSPDKLERLYSEVHLLSKLNHESIIRFYKSWIDIEGRTFNFITEMLTSGTLREYRQKYRTVDIRAIKNWARQILNGLVYLHGHDPPVIHRDLKCDNIFVNGHLGQVKIGDLGFAAVLRGSQAHSVIGTPEFMAPELYEEDYNELVDVYSFGMCVLEMLTSEYPYSECSNSAQIYKKVTSGKLPNAYYKIQDLDAKRFVGKCLDIVSKRLPAKELLLDPFLATVDELLPSPRPNIKTQMPVDNNMVLENLRNTSSLSSPINTIWKTNMTITGNMDPEDDTIYLEVQIADKYVRNNIRFPFDIVTDTPIDVATEMVKELEIDDRQLFDIAEVIDREISALVPQWKEWDQSPRGVDDVQSPHHSYRYLDDDENDGAAQHPFYSFSSCSSSQASLSGLLPPSGTHYPRGDDLSYGLDWIQDCLQGEDDTSSQGSQYSNMNYHYGNERNDCDLISSTTTKDKGVIGSTTKEPVNSHLYHQILKQTPKCTRFCPDEKMVTGYQPDNSKHCKQYKGGGGGVGSYAASSSGNNDDKRQLTRNRSLVDVRSQLLHRSLVEEVNKRRLFKTVATVENIGFQDPFKGDSSKPICLSPSSADMNCLGKVLRSKSKNKEVFKW